jgi:hypothetical protein
VIDHAADAKRADSPDYQRLVQQALGLLVEQTLCRARWLTLSIDRAHREDPTMRSLRGSLDDVPALGTPCCGSGQPAPRGRTACRSDWR